MQPTPSQHTPNIVRIIANRAILCMLKCFDSPWAGCNQPLLFKFRATSVLHHLFGSSIIIMELFRANAMEESTEHTPITIATATPKAPP